MSSYSHTESLLLTLRTLHSQLCSSSASASDRDSSASLEATINQIPFVASWASSRKVTNNSEFCRAYNEDSRLFFHDTLFTAEPMIQAQQNFNQCLEIANRSNTAITHDYHPRQVAISVYKYDVQKLFSIQGVASKSFDCRIPGTSESLKADSVVAVTQPVTLMCTRAPEARGADEYYAPDQITIGTSEGVAYSVSVASETIYGPTRQSEARADIERLAPLAKRTSELEASIKTDKLELFPFYQTSGPNRGGVRGLEFGWYEFNGKSEEAITSMVKHRLCPTAIRARYAHVTDVSGNCCGKRQYIMVCSYANPEAGKHAASYAEAR